MNPINIARDRYGLTLSRSTRKGKKWMFRRPDTGQLVHFGAKGMQDYTQHRDETRRAAYRARHRAIMTTINGKRMPAYKAKYSSAWASWNILW